MHVTKYGFSLFDGKVFTMLVCVGVDCVSDLSNRYNFSVFNFSRNRSVIFLCKVNVIG